MRRRADRLGCASDPTSSGLRSNDWHPSEMCVVATVLWWMALQVALQAMMRVGRVLLS